MKISCISDLHIKSDNDKSFETFQKFMNHPRVISSNRIYLLGDIFDLMIGGHQEYVKKHIKFFELLAEKIKNNIEIYFIEGNHDFHLEAVFEYFLNLYALDSKKFKYLKDEEVIKINDRNTLFCHGDIVDDTNTSFQKWKAIYRSKAIRILVNRLMPYFLLKKIGEEASKDSKKRNSKTFNFDKSKKLYREGAKRLFDKMNIDIIVAGHTHILEEERIGNGLYLNNGFPLKDKKFVYLSPNENKLISLEES